MAVALVNFDGVVDVVDEESVVGYILHKARTAAALEIAGQGGGGVGPHFDASTVLEGVRYWASKRSR